MKKTIYLFASAITMFFAFSSCDKGVTDPDTTLNFSTLPVEQQKKSIEQSGLDLADRMTTMQQTKGYVALTQFLNNSGSLSPALVSTFRQLQIGISRNDVKALENFNNQMRVTSNLGSDLWGTWTWNPTTKNFDKASGIIPNQAVISFPACDLKSTVNNAVLTILYAESNVLIPHSNPAEFYPKTISAILKIDNVEAINAQYSGIYATDGTPTSILQTLVIGEFNWTVSSTNTNTDVSASYAFKYNSDILLKYEINAKGNFSVTQIDNSNGPEDVFNSGNVTFQIMNVALYGGITDIKSFMAEGNALHGDTTWITTEYGYKYYNINFTKSYYDSEVTIFNKYLKFYGYFATEKQKFADVEFYTAEEQGKDYNYNNRIFVYTTTSTNYIAPTVYYDGCDYVYNYDNNGNYLNTTYKYYIYPSKTIYNLQPRLVLSDGSKITDFDTYATDNFSTVITKFQNMFK
ncbi:MAG: hypothetical protein WCL70_04890 [Paludibacter sp.]